MGIHTTDAIVLRRYPYRETSVIVTCLTERYGKLKGLVKGLCVQPNRHRSPMEPMTVNRIVFYDTASSQLHLIGQCELLKPLSGLARDVETLTLAAQCVEVADAALPLEEPQPNSYRLLRQALECLDGGTDDAHALKAHFIVRLLRLAGFQPQLDECTGCSRRLQEHGYWSPRHGGLLCARCLHEDPHAEGIRAELLEALGQLAEAEELMPLPEAVATSLCERLEIFLRWHLHHPLKTMKTNGMRKI